MIDKVTKVHTEAPNAEILSVTMERGNGSRATAVTSEEPGKIVSTLEIANKGAPVVKWSVRDIVDGSREVIRQIGSGKPLAETFDNYLTAMKKALAPHGSGVDFKLGGSVYATEYSSVALAVIGKDAEGNACTAVASMGIHNPFPYPGEYWGNAQIVVLGPNGEQLHVLGIPKDLEACQAPLLFEDITLPNGQPGKCLIYEGYMEDKKGEKHFVRAELVLGEKEVVNTRPRVTDHLGAAARKLIGFHQNAKALSLADAKLSALHVDGKAVMKTIDKAYGGMDDKARFDVLFNTPDLALNYAPSDMGGLLSTVDPETGAQRYRYTTSLMRRSLHELAKLLPEAITKGITSLHQVADTNGNAHTSDDKSVEVVQTYHTATVPWHFHGKYVADIDRSLVKVKVTDKNGHEHLEYGFQELITPRR